MNGCAATSSQGGWVIAIEPEIHLGTGPDKLVPDLAGWRAERFPELLADQDLVHIDVAPDWVCEVLSPSTENRDRRNKMRIYAPVGPAASGLISRPSTLFSASSRGAAFFGSTMCR
ncbi:MAG: Uma2 family endonuclease [Polyangiaceae bacterium]